MVRNNCCKWIPLRLENGRWAMYLILRYCHSRRVAPRKCALREAAFARRI
jgi:hypothetical protein